MMGYVCINVVLVIIAIATETTSRFHSFFSYFEYIGPLLFFACLMRIQPFSDKLRSPAILLFTAFMIGLIGKIYTTIAPATVGIGPEAFISAIYGLLTTIGWIWLSGRLPKRSIEKYCALLIGLLPVVFGAIGVIISIIIADITDTAPTYIGIIGPTLFMGLAE